MDFLDSIKTYIENTVDLFVQILQVGLLADGNSIAIRPTPGGEPERYLDSSKIVRYQFQILVAHSNTKIAYDTTEAISKALDILNNDGVIGNGFKLIKCENYVPTNFVQKNEGGEMIFTALFNAELEIKEV